MQRLFFPVVLLTLVGVVVLSERPGVVGDLLALADNWDQWSQPGGGASPRSYVPPGRSMPVQPSASSRPDSWPGSARQEMPGQSLGEATVSDYQPAGPNPAPQWTPEAYPQTPYPQTPYSQEQPFPQAQSTRQVPQDQYQPVQPRPEQPVPSGNFNRPPLQVANLPQGAMPSNDAVRDQSRSARPESRIRGRSRPTREADPAQIEGSEIVAKVGFEVILAREVSQGAPKLREYFQKVFEENKDKAPPELLQAQIKEAMDAQLLKMMQKQLEQKVEDKLLYLGATRQLPADGLKQLKEMIAKDYESRMIPKLMKAYEAGSRRELEEKVERLDGISLDMHKRQFIEYGIGQWWLGREVKADEDVSHEELLTYYREHTADFEKPGQARWEQLMIRKTPDPGEAYAKLAWMGNQVLDGVPFAEVAKTHSQGSTAAQGGEREWTAQGSLVSKVLDKAIFSPNLKPAELSPILEDEQGYHIIRVIERQETQRQPFHEAQVKIREKIVANRKADAKAAFLVRLRKETPVWMAPNMQSEIQSPNGLRIFN